MSADVSQFFSETISKSILFPISPRTFVKTSKEEGL